MAKDKLNEKLSTTKVSMSEDEIIIEENDESEETIMMRGRETKKPKPGNVISIRMIFKIQGLGSFTCGGYNTATGANGGWFKFGWEYSHQRHKLSAKPAPNWSFSHWLFNGNFASINPEHFTYPIKGLEITAVFNQS